MKSFTDSVLLGDKSQVIIFNVALMIGLLIAAVFIIFVIFDLKNDLSNETGATYQEPIIEPDYYVEITCPLDYPYLIELNYFINGTNPAPQTFEYLQNIEEIRTGAKITYENVPVPSTFNAQTICLDSP